MLERNVLLAYEPLPIDTRNYRSMLVAYYWLDNVGRAQNDHHILVKCHDNDPAMSYDTWENNKYYHIEKQLAKTRAAYLELGDIDR